MREEPQSNGNCLVGVISDTHGILAEEAIKAFSGTDMIIHAGDIDRPEVLESLAAIAPVTAVRGNMDAGAWADSLNKTEIVSISEVMIYVLHDLDQLDLDLGAGGFRAVIHGHTHRPAEVEHNGVLFLNPGSAGYPRRSTPPSIALLDIHDGSIDVRFVELE